MNRVLYIHHSGGRGGSSNSLINLLNFIPDNIIDIHIMTVDGPVVDLFKLITKKVYVVNSMPLFGTTSGVDNLLFRNFIGFMNYLKIRKKIKNIISEINPDIIHINEITSIQIAKIAKSIGIKVVCHIRIVPDLKYPWINFHVKKMLGKYVDEIICIDESVANNYKEFTNLNVIYNMLNISENINIVNHNSKIVNCVFLSNLLRHKGVFEILKASEILKDEENIKFLIVGGNTKSDVFFKSILGKILEMLRIHVNIEKKLSQAKLKGGLSNVFINGHTNNIGEFLEQSHILLFPSFMNGPSRSIFEAGVYGIPSIIALKDKVEDVVTDGFNGYIIDEGDYISLANKIKVLVGNVDLRKNMGLNSRERFLKLNSSKSAKLQILSIYNRLANVNK